MNSIARVVAAATVASLTACGTTQPYETDPCRVALVCKVTNGVTEYLDPGATGAWGGSGSASRYVSPQVLTIFNTQGRRTGTIK